MRILWLSHFLPYPPKGGAKQRSYNLIKEISKEHSVYLFVINHEAGASPEAYEAFSNFCSNVNIINLNASYINKVFRAVISLFYPIPYTAFWLLNTSVVQALKDVLRTTKHDIIHFDSIDLCEYLKYIKMPCKIKFLNHHNIESQMMYRRFLKTKNILLRLYFLVESIKLIMYEKRMCRKFDYNLTVSHLDKLRILKTVPDIKVEIVPNGVDLEYFKPNTKDCAEPFSLVFTGGMDWYPNRDAMIFFAKEIWPILCNRIPRVKMRIVGTSPPKYLLKISRQQSNFIVLGFVEDVRPYLEKTLVYICPIKDGGGTKLKILDALAAGKPVVAHPVAIEGIEAVSGKHLLTAQTPSDFVGQIETLFNDAGLRNSLADEGRKLVIEKYDFKKIGKRLADLYNK